MLDETLHNVQVVWPRLRHLERGHRHPGPGLLLHALPVESVHTPGGQNGSRPHERDLRHNRILLAGQCQGHGARPALELIQHLCH